MGNKTVWDDASTFCNCLCSTQNFSK